MNAGMIYAIGHPLVQTRMAAKPFFVTAMGLNATGHSLVGDSLIPLIYDKIGGRSEYHQIGGSIVNMLAVNAQLGCKSVMVGKTGHDVGEDHFAAISELGIAIHPAPDTRLKTGQSIILTTDAGQSKITCLGSASSLQADDVDVELLQQANWLLVEAAVMASEGGKNAILKAMVVAMKNKIKIALSLFDLEIFQSLESFPTRTLSEVASCSDIILTEQDCALSFTGVDDPLKATRQLLELASAVFMIDKCNFVLVGDNGIIDSGAISEDRSDFQTYSAGVRDATAGAFLNGVLCGLPPCYAMDLGIHIGQKVSEVTGPRLEQLSVRDEDVEKFFTVNLPI